MLVDALLCAAESASAKHTLSDPFIEITYPNLARLANVLRRHVEKTTTAERVGLMLPSSVGFVGAYFGILWARRVPVPLNYLLQPAELAAVVADAGLDTIFATKFFEKALTGLPVKIVYMEDLPLKREVALAHLQRTPSAPTPAPDETATILYTSGTSGTPKGVCLSYRNLASNADDCIKHARLAEEHQFLGILPLFHSFGLTAMLHAPVRAVASVHYLPRFTPAGIIEAVRTRKASVLMLIASMYTALMRVKDAAPEDLASLIYPISGGEALPMKVFEAFKSRFGREILQGYGMTETSPVISLNTPWNHKIGSVGLPIANVTVAAHDDAGTPLPTGQTGELWVQGPCVMQGYYKKEAETRAVKTDTGWLKTGDMGVVDADGYITITGRKKELIIVGGENVYPREIEAALEEHPAVAEAAAIGKQDASRGETVVAFVTLKEGAAASDLELREFCRDRLANYKVPRQVLIRSDLPRGPTGKILKRALPALLSQGTNP